MKSCAFSGAISQRRDWGCSHSVRRREGWEAAAGMSWTSQALSSSPPACWERGSGCWWLQGLHEERGEPALPARALNSGGIQSLAPTPQIRHPGWSSHQVGKHPKNVCLRWWQGHVQTGMHLRAPGCDDLGADPPEPHLGNCTRAGGFFHG